MAYPVAVLDTESGPLVAEPDHPIRVTREVSPISVTTREPGRLHRRLRTEPGRTRAADPPRRGARAADRPPARGNPRRRRAVRHQPASRGGHRHLRRRRRGRPKCSSPASPFTASGTSRSTTIPAVCPPDLAARVLHNDTPWTGHSSAPTSWSTGCRPTSPGDSGATSSPCQRTARSATNASAGSGTRRSSPRPPAATPTSPRSSPAGCGTWSTGRTPTARSGTSHRTSACGGRRHRPGATPA